MTGGEGSRRPQRTSAARTSSDAMFRNDWRTSGIQSYKSGVHGKSESLPALLFLVFRRLMYRRNACFSLRRRFEQNQQDISFTVMALLPALSKHILQGMDVESVTQELQSYSRALKPRLDHRPPPIPSQSSLTSSTENPPGADPETRSDNGSVSVISSVDGVQTDMSASSASWVDQFSSLGSSQVSAVSPSSGANGEPSGSSPSSLTGADLTESILTTSSMSSSSAAPGTSNQVCHSAPFIHIPLTHVKQRLQRMLIMICSVHPQEVKLSYGERSKYSVRGTKYPSSVACSHG